MFTPSTKNLAAGMKPACWSIDAPDMDIALQRAGVLAHTHTGFEQNVTEYRGDGLLCVYEDILSDKPAGEVSIIASTDQILCGLAA